MEGRTFVDGTHHCAIYAADDHGASHRNFDQCKLNPGHEKFLTVEQFKEKAPSLTRCQEEEETTDVWNIIARTVRIVVSCTSVERPDTYPNCSNPYPCKDVRGNNYRVRYGTGFVNSRGYYDKEKEPCPCQDCKYSCTPDEQERERYYFGITTATHVIFDEHEAKAAVFELFYDTEDREGVEFLYGVTARGQLQTDRCYVLCVTHDRSLADKLNEMCDEINGFPFGILVSHPHGVSKRICIGDFSHQKFILIHSENSAKLLKDTEVRFSGCHGDGSGVESVVELVNRCLTDQEPVIGFVNDENGRKTLRLLCDITIHFPDNTLIQHNIKGEFSLSKFCEDQWWSLPAGTELVTDSGKRCSIPHEDFAHDIRMEVSAKETLYHYNFSKIFGENCRLCHSSTYDMASCPGSSGAPVFFHKVQMEAYLCVRDGVHYGRLGGQNSSGLDDGWIYHCLHA